MYPQGLILYLEWIIYTILTPSGATAANFVHTNLNGIINIFCGTSSIQGRMTASKSSFLVKNVMIIKKMSLLRFIYLVLCFLLCIFHWADIQRAVQ